MRSRSFLMTALMPLSVSLLVIACGNDGGGGKKATATKAPANPTTQDKGQGAGTGGGRGSEGAPKGMDTSKWKSRAMEAKTECPVTINMNLLEAETKVDPKTIKDNQAGTWQLTETQIYAEVVDLNDKTKKDQITGESVGVLDESFVQPKYNDELLQVTCFTSNIQKLTTEENSAKTETSDTEKEAKSRIIPFTAGNSLPQSIDRKTGKIAQFRGDVYVANLNQVSAASTLLPNANSTVDKIFASSNAGATFIVTKLGDKLIIRGETVKLVENSKSLNKTIRFRGIYEAK